MKSLYVAILLTTMLSSSVAFARFDIGLSGGYLRVVDLDEDITPQGGSVALNIAWLAELGVVRFGPDIQVGFDYAKDDNDTIDVEISSIPVMFGLKLAIPLGLLEPYVTSHVGFTNITFKTDISDENENRFTYDATAGLNLILGPVAVGPAFIYRFNDLKKENNDEILNNLIAMLYVGVRFGE